MLFSHLVLLEVEAGTGLNILAGEFHAGKLSGAALRTTLEVLMRHAGATYTYREIGGMIRLGNLVKVRESVVEAWRVAMPEDEPEVQARAATKANAKARAKTMGGAPLELVDDTANLEPAKPNTWLDVWANNRQTLGLTDEEWLAYTPRMIQQLSRERLDLVRQQELMLSRIGAATVNFSMCHPKQPVKDGHFMVHPYPDPGQREIKKGEDVLAALSAFGKVFPLAGESFNRLAQAKMASASGKSSGKTRGKTKDKTTTWAN